jgi:hypothetical protein
MANSKTFFYSSPPMLNGLWSLEHTSSSICQPAKPSSPTSLDLLTDLPLRDRGRGRARDRRKGGRLRQRQNKEREEKKMAGHIQRQRTSWPQLILNSASFHSFMLQVLSDINCHLTNLTIKLMRKGTKLPALVLKLAEMLLVSRYVGAHL